LAHLIRNDRCAICIAHLAVFNAGLFEPSRYGDFSLLGKLHRVREKVHTDLLNALLVTKDVTFWDIYDNFGLLASSLHLDDANNLNNGLLHLHMHILGLEGSALDLCMI
jgi:hypothetical protein